MRFTEAVLTVVHELPPSMLYFQLDAPLAVHETAAVVDVILLTVRFVGADGTVFIVQVTSVRSELAQPAALRASA